MKGTYWVLSLASTLLLVAAAVAQTADKPGSKDPELFTRMPNFFIAESWEHDFDANDFTVQKGEGTDTKHIEGQFLKIHYILDSSRGAKEPSSLQILRNYKAAALKAGGQILYEHDPEYLTARFIKGGKETWVGFSGGSSSEYVLTVVEKQEMQQDVVANEEALHSGLSESGHAEVPGILFDFGKSEVKPESEPALKEIVKLMQETPKLKVWVVGHTDNVGSAESNVILSNARAAAVVKVLTQKMGIPAGRLASFGAGPYAPKVSNATEDGRAQNRRVELVEQP
jgi:OmpA-OmpF porin, OOP family